MSYTPRGCIPRKKMTPTEPYCPGPVDYNRLYKHNTVDCRFHSTSKSATKCYHPSKTSGWMRRGVFADDKFDHKTTDNKLMGLDFQRYTPFTYDPQFEETHFEDPSCQGFSGVRGLWFRHSVKPFALPSSKCACDGKKKCFKNRKFV